MKSTSACRPSRHRTDWSYDGGTPLALSSRCVSVLLTMMTGVMILTQADRYRGGVGFPSLMG